MSAKKSRWEDEEEDPAELQRQQEEKERKRRLKEEKRKAKEVAQEAAKRAAEEEEERAAKREKVEEEVVEDVRLQLRFPTRHIESCRHVDSYEKLNHIEEGSYGVVFRAKDVETGEIYALKKLKLEKEKNGFPLTSLREITTLLACPHPNIVRLREIVHGDTSSSIFLVMEFVPHDIRSILEDNKEPFLISEVKTLMLQLLSATAYMHDRWIIHRDLKTTNLLMTNRGELKVADFGLARYTSDPAPALTQLVVTLWYRAPELLLGARTYGTEVDVWSVGCIMAELVTGQPLFQGRGELDMIGKIFNTLGPPTDSIWTSYRDLQHAKSITFPPPRPGVDAKTLLRTKFPMLTSAGVDLMSQLLTFDPKRRITAKEALEHPWFAEDPRPKHPDMFPSFPSRANGEKVRKVVSPNAPVVEHGIGAGGTEGLFGNGGEDMGAGGGFQLRVT
ncbi:Pkinase-domain-containing protein [Saitoella complicata NRRL Y-17804]|uniref:Pkinase-domain-containing protein n=1 Tax=Saitoella complicata (strain BCRC 22490 / CBS 7301 / JCM 7358 / NBRC 10748 / NRRL Y-17804) TaxID=698492 RepID=UPI00086783A8|nr:Pkinase-domain-containing protein [Saitoella complicata NRRL Y-17804]ODQ49933.1 Pkinase-domain-containing protein [Saitoella complicata NRRL Y-17804]